MRGASVDFISDRGKASSHYSRRQKFSQNWSLVALIRGPALIAGGQVAPSGSACDRVRGLGTDPCEREQRGEVAKYRSEFRARRRCDQAAEHHAAVGWGVDRKSARFPAKPRGENISLAGRLNEHKRAHEIRAPMMDLQCLVSISFATLVGPYPVWRREMSEKTPKIEARRSSIHGLGVYVVHPIRAGETIVEVVGERISSAESDRRHQESDADAGHTFMFYVDEDTVIDCGVGGNVSAFINHSCDPNCEAVDDQGRIFVEALRDLHVGEELVYDYRIIWESSDDPEDLKVYLCRCGSQSCRGTMLDVEPLMAAS